MKKGAFVFSALLFAGIAVSQQYFKKQGCWPVGEAGYFKQGDQHRIDATLGLHRVTYRLKKTDSADVKVYAFSWGPSLGLIGFVNEKNTFRVGQQAGLSATFNYAGKVPLGLRGGFYVENYTKKDQRISLAGGPLLLGIIHCQYGYSIPLGKETIPGIGRHRLGVIIYLNPIGVIQALDRMPMM